MSNLWNNQPFFYLTLQDGKEFTNSAEGKITFFSLDTESVFWSDFLFTDYEPIVNEIYKCEIKINNYKLDDISECYCIYSCKYFRGWSSRFVILPPNRVIDKRSLEEIYNPKGIDRINF